MTKCARTGDADVNYLDTSAFLKLIVDETHSKSLRRAIAAAELWSSTLLAVEAHRAGIRLGLAPEAVDARLAVVTFVVPSESTFEVARSIGPANLRTLDAVHLAAATELGDDLEGLITYDQRLAAACASIGIEVIAPGSRPRWWTL